ncbi:MAG: hypothetical protein IJI03_12310 [Rudaea sp.]|nr:hypothetical protein [Rudaea sp.]
MKTSIKFHALPGLDQIGQLTSLKQAIDLELKKPAILMSFLDANKHLARNRFASNDPRDGKAADVSRDDIKSFLASNVHMLMAAEAQKQPGAVAAAGKAFFGEKYSTASDNPILTDLAAQFAAFFHSNMPDIDTGWMQLFDLVDLRNSPHDHFDIDDTNAGITYTQVSPGAAIKKRTKITESKTSCGYLTFGAGLGLLDDWISKQMFWKIDEVVSEFRTQHFDKMASQHYGLFTALGAGINQAFVTDDATTFNAGASTLLRNLRKMGYGVGQNTGLKIVCAPEKAGRIMRMLQAQQGSQLVAFGTMKEPIAYTVDAVISSTWIPANDAGYYLLLPGKKLKRGLWQDLSIEQQRNAAARATDWYASAQYNAIVGDTNQIVRVLYS